MQEIPFQPSSPASSTPTATIEPLTHVPPASIHSSPTPPQTPQHPSWQTPESEVPKSGKGLIIGLIALVVLAIVGVGIYWFFFKEKQKRLASNPQEMFVNSVEQIVTARDLHVEWEIELWNIFDVLLYGDEFAKKEYAKYLDPKDTKLILSSDTVRNGVLMEDGDLTMQLQSPNAGTNVSMNIRSVDKKVYLQLATFTMKEVVFDFSPILNTWISMDMQELFADSAFAEALSAEDTQFLLANPFDVLRLDLTTYFDIFKETYLKHLPLQMEVLSEKSKDGMTVVMATGDIEKAKAFSLDFAPKAYVQFLTDVDSSIAHEETASSTAYVTSLKKFREEMVKEMGEDGSKLKKKMEDKFSVATNELPSPDTSASVVPDTFFPLPEGPKPKYISSYAELTYNNKNGRLVGVHGFATYEMPDTKEKKTIALAKASFSKYNSGIIIAQPEKSKTIKEMLPLVIGVIASASMYSPNATSTEIIFDDQADGPAPVEKSMDSDGDGADDDLEKIWQTNPFEKDTDGDGYDDYSEVKNGFSPLGPGKIPADKQMQYSL